MKAIRSILLLSGMFWAFGAWSQDQLNDRKQPRTFDLGVELIHHRDYSAARSLFSDYLEQAPPDDPHLAEASYYLAFATVSVGHPDGEKLIDNFIRKFPADPRSATAYLELAEYFYKQSNFSKAITYYDKVDFQLLGKTQQNEAHFNRGYSYFNLKRFPEALEQFNFIKKQSTKYTPAASYYAGFIYYGDGQFDSALEDLKRASLYPAYAKVVPHLIALCMYKLGKYDDLIAYSQSLGDTLNTVNSAREIYALTGDAYYFKKDFQKALEYYDRHLEGQTGKDKQILFRAGFANYSLNRDDKAIQYFKDAAGQDSTGYFASYYLGVLYLKHDNKPYALNAFEIAGKCTTCGNLAEESIFQAGKINYDLGRPDRAIEVMEDFRTTYPQSVHATEVKELLAQAYVNGNNYNKAIQYIEELPRRTPAVDMAYQKATYLKGVEYFNNNEFADAVKMFEKSLQYPLDKKYVALASLWCGEAFSIGEKYEEASQQYLTVIGLGTQAEPDVILKTRYGLGYAFFNLEQYDRALVSFKEFTNRATQKDAIYVDAMIRLGDCYYVSKNYDDALTAYNKARQFNSSDNDYVFLQMGMIYGINRKYSESGQQFDVLITSYPKSTYRDEAMFQNAQFEIEQGHYEAAVKRLTQLITEMRNSKFLPLAFMRRAASNFNLKQYDKSAEDYAFVIRNFSTQPVAKEAILPLQEVLNLTNRGGEFDDFLAKYKQANPEDTKNLESVEFEASKNTYFSQQYDRAVTRLSAFITNYPTSAHLAETKYYLAESYYRQTDLDKALAVYDELSRSAFPQQLKVVSRISEIQFRQGKLEQAIVSFHKQERMAETKKDLYIVWSGMMESFYLLGTYDSTEYYARQVLDKANVNSSAQNRASLFLGKAAMGRGDYETAKDEFLNAINTAHDENGAEAKYRLGEIFFLTKKYKQCYETLINIEQDFSGYDEWVGKAYILIADNFVAQGDRKNAKLTLASVSENSSIASVKEMAKAKLDALELEDKPKEVQPDSTGNEIK